MQAWAAEAAAEHGAEPFYATAEFWVALGFIIFVAVVFRTAYRVVTLALDDRADKIKNQIDEAARLAEEAQELLASYERKQREVAEEAEGMIERARNEADRLADQAAEDLEKSLKRRRQLAMDRIAQAETAAIAEVRNRAVEIALNATQQLMVESVKGKTGEKLLDAAIAELPEKLH
jgi:F-type H+-transporting ATPase subunit b